jgi:hypothetical protein
MYFQENPMNEPLLKTPPTARRGGQKTLALFSTVLFFGIALYASRSSLLPAPADDPKDKKSAARTPHAVAAANKLLDALDANQREKALYEFGSTKKSNWSNLPVSFVPRNGVRLGDLTKEQRTLAMAVLAAVLSKGGYQKIIDIVDGDQQLAEAAGRGGRGGGKGRGPIFGADQYYLAFFGKPSETKPWMVQFGGHHLGLNVTVIGKHFVLTPTHTGAQPALFKRNGMEVRPLGVENDTAFKLVNALDDKQRAQAVVGERPQRDLLLGPGRDGQKMPKPEGIQGSALTGAQQAMLLELISAWVNIVEPEAAEARMDEIKRQSDDLFFSWKGPTTKGSAVYFRVQGPSVWIEYAPQGGTDHIHTVVRNPKDDYGAGLVE